MNQIPTEPLPLPQEAQRTGTQTDSCFHHLTTNVVAKHESVPPITIINSWKIGNKDIMENTFTLYPNFKQHQGFIDPLTHQF